MKRYKMINGVFVAPPKGGVSVEGRVISNFAGRVQNDAAFAAANGYYPVRVVELATEELLEDHPEREATYSLKNGEWVFE